MTARILVVDDEPDLEPLIRQRFRRSIRDGDWSFSFAHDGQEALAYLGSGAQVDVVLSDINMPNMDGLTLLSRLRERQDDLKVVIVSAYADMGNIREAMNRGAFDFITKPMDLADLELTIDKTMQHLQTVRRLRDERDAAQDLARMKGEFIANVSHEIRTPMNAILGLAHLALQDPVQDHRSAYFRKIQGAGQHLLSIINDILDMSKIGVGKLVLDARPFDLRQVLADALAMVEDQAAHKGLALGLHVGPRVPCGLVGDARRIGQVLLNYLGNAVKFTESGGVRLEIDVDGGTDGEPMLRLAVRDTGPGLQAAQITRLFRAFEQADGSGTRRHGGTGLGLSIAKSLAEMMGGHVGVDSEPGHGSRFWFTVPLRPDPAAAARFLPEGDFRDAADGAAAPPPHAPAAPAWPDLRGARILLAEDNPLNVDVARGLLAPTGASVDVVADGLQAAERAAAQAYDLILMDIQMPVLDGLAATRRIRAEARQAGLPIIAMTASAMAEESARCYEAGMNDLIAKPVEPQRLYAALQRWLRPRDRSAGAAAVVRATARPDPPAPPRTAPWDARSLSIAGLDVQAGLAGVLGQQALYVRTLRRFATSQDRAAGELRAAWRGGDREAAERIAHTVKGLCGTFGATDLGERAAGLEAALRQGADAAEVEALIDAFEATLIPLCAAVRAALPAAS